MNIQELVPFFIILTFPIILVGVVILIRRSKKLVFIFDDKLLKSPMRLSIILLGTAVFYLLYSFLIFTIFGVESRGDYMWNLVGLLVSASHLVKTKGAPFEFIVLYVFTMLIGLFVYGIFISNLVGFVKERLKKLSKGRTKVISTNHVLIIGKSKYIYSIIDQYISSSMMTKNNQKIVVFTEENPDKVMADIEKNTLALRKGFKSIEEEKLYQRLLQKKVIYRTGNTSSIHDLEMCNIHSAKSVILLGSDSDKIKTLLAVNATKFKVNEESFVISKFDDMEMLNVAERNDFTDDYDLINIDYLISNLTVQTTIQKNLSYIYNDLLDFSKCSIEFIKVKRNSILEPLIGKNYDFASHMFSNAVVIGVKNETLTINPKADGNIVIKENDQLIIIKDPNNQISLNPNYKQFINDTIINKTMFEYVKGNQNLVIIGYSDNTPEVLKEFNNIISKESVVTILCNDKYKLHINIDKIKEEIDVDFNVSVEFYETFEFFKSRINELDKGNDIDSIIVLPNKFIDKQRRDDDSIFTLMDLRHLERENNRDYNITIDLSDIQNHNLIENLDIADVIISDKLSAQLIYHFATHREMKTVYEELLGVEGDEIYSQPITKYINDLSKPISFYTLGEAALSKNEIAIGYKIGSKVTMLTKEKSELLEFTEEDHIIVISKGH